MGDYTVDVELPGFQTAHLTVTVLSNTAPVLHVQLEIAAVSEAVRVSANPEGAYPVSITPTTLVSRGDIESTPGAGRTNSTSMVTSFVPGSYVTHDQLHVRGGHQVSWLVDGVPVPNTNIASNVGPQFDPKDADYIEVHRGSYGAEYGDRTYAVFNVVPRTGFERNNDAEIVASAGSYSQTNDHVSVGGHSQRFAYYASMNGNRSELGLETPVADVIHDRQTGLGGFATLFFNANPANQLRLATSVRRDTYQVPNDARAQAAGVDDVEREADAFVNLSWVRSFPSGGLWSVFAQDTFRATSWLSLTGGVRQTHFSGALGENATSPRAGASIRIPSLGWTARAFYGRFYQAPPLLTASGPLLDFVTSQNLALIPLRGERDEEVQAGVMVPLRGWTIDADVFRTKATNFFDHNSVGNSNVFFPLTIGGALVRGAELTVRSPRAWKVAQFHLAYSRQVAQGLGGISAGLDAHLPRGVFAGANLYYGSGFPDAGGPARLDGHTTMDLVAGKAFGGRFSLSLTALNVTNRHLLIDNSPTFGGTHFNNPREAYAEVRYRFHY